MVISVFGQKGSEIITGVSDPVTISIVRDSAKVPSVKNVKTDRNGIPIMLSRREAKQRNRANQLRLQEMAIVKLAATYVVADSIKGYEGWLVNYTKNVRCTFYIHSIEGGEKPSLTLEPGDRISYNLLPGEYMYWVEYASINNGGFVTKESPEYFDVGPQMKFVSDPKIGWTHWAIMKH